MDNENLFEEYWKTLRSNKKRNREIRARLSLILLTDYNFSLTQSGKLLSVSGTTIKTDLAQFDGSIKSN